MTVDKTFEGWRIDGKPTAFPVVAALWEVPGVEWTLAAYETMRDYLERKAKWQKEN